ncbi:HNH endonuclease [Noviherbaspirillum autotrophicum]|uniref:HNH endonuclease n=1 Tax=Noviherbaspirillum autotrophicum TaxID=709839 RepID=UPI000A0726B3
MPNSLSRSRSIAHTCQGGRCYYCHVPTWLNIPDQFAFQYRLSPNETRLLQATAEHLTARQDGGSNARPNIVAACYFCNSRRHRRKTPPSPEAYKLRVERQIAKGRWHSSRILERTATT